MRFALKEGDARKASTRRFLYALRAGLRRAGGSFSFITQHLRPSVCARARPRWLDVLGYSIPPCRAGLIEPVAVCTPLGVSDSCNHPARDGWADTRLRPDFFGR